MKITKVSKDLIVGSLTLGALGSIPIGNVGKTTQAMSNYLPAMGSIAGAGITIGMLKELNQKKRR